MKASSEFQKRDRSELNENGYESHTQSEIMQREVFKFSLRSGNVESTKGSNGTIIS